MDSRWSPPNPPGLPGVHLEYVEQGKVLMRRFPCPRVVVCVCALLPMSACCCPCLRIVVHVCTLLPVSVCCCPCLRIVARVRVLLPMSARCCPCLRVVAHVRTSLLVAVRRCPRPFTFVGDRFHLWVWVVAFARGQSSSFGGGPSSFVGGPFRSWAMARCCGGGEPLVGGGESSGLA